MSEQSPQHQKEVEKQSELFSPDGTPSPEVVKAIAQFENEQNIEYQKKLQEEIEYRIWERGKDHAP